MPTHNDAFRSVMGDLKKRIGEYGSERMNRKSEHHEPDGDEDAKGHEPDEDSFDLETCENCGEDHRTVDCDK